MSIGTYAKAVLQNPAARIAILILVLLILNRSSAIISGIMILAALGYVVFEAYLAIKGVSTPAAPPAAPAAPISPPVMTAGSAPVDPNAEMKTK